MPNSTTELMPATVREWTDILARVRFGKVGVGRRNITGATIKLVASRLADYADSNGTRVRPGLARLALDVEIDYRTAKAAVAHLRGIGLLGLVRAGGRNGADEFRLTLPVDLLDREDLEVWSPTKQRLEIERLSDAHRRLPRGPRRGPDDDEPQGHGAPVKEPGSQGHGAPDKAAKSAPITGAGGPSSESITGAGGHASQGHGAPATDQDLDTTTTDHADGDLRTAVTLPRASAPAPKTPKRCPDHRIQLKPRTDGLAPCPLCRAGAPPTPDALADVIPLDSRRIS